MPEKQAVDVLIIGGGIHGTGIAAEAASRGLSVVLLDKADLGSGASSRTTTLISGGIHSLAKLELDTVRRSFSEQAIMAKRAPHLLRHLAFGIPLDKKIRSNTKIKAGLFLYNTMRPSECKHNPEPFICNPDTLKPDYQNCITYNDCTINDIRLVISNALLARQLGATIRPHTRVVGATRDTTIQLWRVQLENGEVLSARALVNTSGKDTNKILGKALPSNTRCFAQLLRGDHIVLPRLYDEQQGFLLQMEGGQLLYALPYRQNYTLVGSYEQLVDDANNEDEKITQTAIEKMLGTLNKYFKTRVNTSDIVRHFWAIRSAYDDIETTPESISYSVVMDIECPDNYAPLINLFGGRLTNYRSASEKTLELLKPYLEAEKNPSFIARPLPGGDIINGDINQFIKELKLGYPWLPDNYITRYARVYGTLCHQFLESCNSMEDLGPEYDAGLHRKEVDYLVRNEWATSANDILWRRTRLGISFDPAQKETLDTYINSLINQP